MSTTTIIILIGALLTYLARAGGHVFLSRFERVHPRVQAGLDAVPAAVLAAIITPYALEAGAAEAAALAVAALVALRLGSGFTLLIAAAVLIALRAAGF